jgi:hypothetical protein
MVVSDLRSRVCCGLSSRNLSDGGRFISIEDVRLIGRARLRSFSALIRPRLEEEEEKEQNFNLILKKLRHFNA